MNFTKNLRLILLVFALGLVLVAGIASPVGSATAGAAMAASTIATGEESSAQAAQGSGRWTSGDVYPLSGTVAARDQPRAPAWQPGDPIKEIPRRHLRTDYEHTPAPRGYDMDPLAERQARAPVTEDRCSGAVFAIYNKSNGSVAVGTTLLSSLLGVSSNCKSGAGDPIVLYDHMAERWIMTEFTSFGSELCVYISDTGDPTGTWYLYLMPTPNFPDYPKYSVWPDAYYVSTNESGGPAAYAWKRTSMLSKGSATYIRFTAPSVAGFNFQALTPADLDGDRTPLPNEPGIFMRHYDDEAHVIGPPAAWDYLQMWELDVDWANHPAGHTFTQLPSIQTSEFDSALCGLTSFSCFPQRFGGVGLDPLREVIMWRLQYRNFGLYETLVGNFVTDVDGFDLGGIRWFELRRQGPGVGNWTLYQEGTYSPTTTRDRWMGSIAMDGGGNIALGFNMVSSVDLYASLGRTGRLASDPLGLMTTGEMHIVIGAGVNPSNRYGDYNALTLDPFDDCTFWLTGEYNVSSQWGTRINRFRFLKCPIELKVFVGEDEPESEGGKR